MTPDTIEFDSEFFGPKQAGHEWLGKVVTIFRDSTGAHWCAFECIGEPGVHTIHLGSRFFRRFIANA
jgi:hypothetical protein